LEKPLSYPSIWSGGPARHARIVSAAVHCTGAIVLISTATLLIASINDWLCGWQPFGAMAVTTIVLGLGYTMMGEWLNVAVWRSFYSSRLPVRPGLHRPIAIVARLIVLLCIRNRGLPAQTAPSRRLA